MTEQLVARSRQWHSCSAAVTKAGTLVPNSTTKKGGGPMLDMGPYDITALVNFLLGRFACRVPLNELFRNG